jgi:hypothetical protein
MTYKEIIQVLNEINFNVTNQETKEAKKLIAIFNKLKPINDDFLEKRELIKIDHASVDDKGNLLKDEKGEYKFTKESQKALQADIAKLMNEEIKFNKIFISNPKGLESYTFLKDIVDGVTFNEEEDSYIL